MIRTEIKARSGADNRSYLGRDVRLADLAPAIAGATKVHIDAD
jgi:hypothetical protein